MIDKITYLETDSEKFPLAFTLNIMEALQDEYGTLSEWSELIRNQKEPNIKALKFFITEAINEGIDIENEKSDEKRTPITSAKAGRIITEIGFQKVAKTINKMVKQYFSQVTCSLVIYSSNLTKIMFNSSNILEDETSHLVTFRLPG